MAPPGRTGNCPQTTPAPEADTYAGYDPHGMLWTTIQTSDSRPELPQTFKSTALAAAVARRERASGTAIAAADTAAQTGSTTLPQQGKKKPTWQPLPLPKPKTTDFVVVLKPRTRLSLATVFPENGAGSALIAHLGANANRLVTVVMARDQNFILAYTADPLIADKLIGELTVLSSVGPVPLFGYLRADTQDSCYGVVTVRSTDSEAELQQHLYWAEGEILHIRRLGTTNKVRLTFSGKIKPRYVTYDALLILVHPYKKTIPACSQCGSVGHRPDACPGPKPDLCGTCGNTVPLMDGARAHQNALFAPDPTSPGTGAVRSATGRHHPNRPLLHWRANPAPRKAKPATTEAEAARHPRFTAGDSISCHQISTPASWSGDPWAFQARPHSAGTSHREVSIEAAPTCLLHIAPAATRTPACCPRGTDMGCSHPTRTSGERHGYGSLPTPSPPEPTQTTHTSHSLAGTNRNSAT
ncbi:hypothetical protein HPB49_013129 [Dermacentor silvarum]|uniref:Uncharacterized protein n=1 Tax=Dermacentor silvarum TaxID=543639 RepID=A0ACB8D5G1_DERSI|nr:hypothetical protein HPB49_013129 [Dermacentor silvarum]